MKRVLLILFFVLLLIGFNNNLFIRTYWGEDGKVYKIKKANFYEFIGCKISEYFRYGKFLDRHGCIIHYK